MSAAPAVNRRRRILRWTLLLLAATAAVLGLACQAQAATGSSTVPVPMPAASASASPSSPSSAASPAAQDAAPSAAATASASTSCPAGYTPTSEAGQNACTPDPDPSSTSSSTAQPDTGAFGSFDVPDTLDCAPATKALPAACAHVIGDFEVTADDGSITNLTGHVEDFFTQALWEAGKVVLGIGVFILAWSLQMGLARLLLSPMEQLTATYQTQVIGALGLPTLCFMIAVLICGIQLLFRSKTKGFGELALSAVIAGLAGTVFLMPASTLLGSNGVLSTTENVALGVSAISLGQSPNTSDPTAITQPLQNGLIETFERQTNMLIQYGAVLDTPGHVDPCYPIYQAQIRNEARYGIDTSEQINTSSGSSVLNALMDSTWNDMKSCNAGYATFNQNPSIERIFIALATLVADLFVLVLAILVAGGLLTAEVGLSIESVWFVFALVLGILPGGGRSILWRSGARILKWLNSVMFSLVFVALFCVFLQVIMESLSGTDLMLRLTLIDGCTVAGLIFHRRVVNVGKDVAFQMQRRMERMKIGGSGGSAFVRPTMMYDRRPGLGAAALGGALGAELGSVFNPLRPVARLGARGGAIAGRAGLQYGRMVARNYREAGAAEARMGRPGPGTGPGAAGGGGGRGSGGPGGGSGPGGPAGSAPGGGTGSRSSAASAGARSRGAAVRSTLRTAAARAAVPAAAAMGMRPVAPPPGLAGRARTVASAPRVAGRAGAASPTPPRAAAPGARSAPTPTPPPISPSQVPGSVPVAQQPPRPRRASRPAGSPAGGGSSAAATLSGSNPPPPATGRPARTRRGW